MRSKFLNTLLFAIILASILPDRLFAEDGIPTAGTYREMFRVSPLKAYRYAAALRNYPKKITFDDNELELLEDGLDGKLDKISFDDAVLTVSGVKDKAKRDYYKVQIEGMVERCRAASEKANTPEQKADQIMRCLLSGPLKPGYSSKQLRFTGTLDEGTYNCVCSSIMFQLMTHRLNINAVTVTVPRHVFCRVGKIDFETTSGTFISATKRDERYLPDRLPIDNEPGAPFEKKFSRETNDLGLLALLYFNEGATMYQNKTNPDYGGGVVKLLKAACLDTNSRWIAINLEKNLRNWFNAELKNKRFKEAKWVADFYKKVIREEFCADELYTALNAGKAKAGGKDASMVGKN
jgi:hypothetical protein